MLSTAPPSSPPSVDVLSSLESLFTSQLSSPQLPYRNIEHLSIPQQIHLSNHPGSSLIRPSSPLAPPDDFPDSFPTLEEIEEEGQFDIDEEESVGEAAANRAFLDKNLESDWDSDSDSESVNNPEADQPESHDSLSSKGSKASTRLKSLVATSSTSYAREKLIRILNGDILIPKQRWGMDRILASLTYHRKDKRLRLFYRQFKLFAFRT